MNAVSKNIQLQYEGFLNTPLLWKEDAVFNISQFEMNLSNPTPFNSYKKPEIRLGKRVEQFALFTFQLQKNIEILTENRQIQDGTTTIGVVLFFSLKFKQNDLISSPLLSLL